MASRGWVFTVNNYSHEEDKSINELGSAEGTRYLVFGREKGENGTPHLQGYIELRSVARLSGVKKLIPRAHWEARKGTPDEAEKYCKKEGDYQEFGVPLAQGKRRDLEEVASMVRDGASMREVDAVAPALAVQYHRGLMAMMSRQMKDRAEPPEVVWLWGLTGTGKTREAVEGPSFYMKDGTKWWDGYEQQEKIVIDDFDGSWPFRDFLRLLDRYPYQGQTKGGYVKINSPSIVITCEFPPEKWWKGTELAQVQRRLTKVIHKV